LSQATQLQQAGKSKEALAVLEKLQQRYPDTWVAAEALLRRGQINAQGKWFVEAELVLDTLIEKMGGQFLRPRGPDAAGRSGSAKREC